MIKTLIFDFGDVFINLDKKGAMANALNLFQIETFPDELVTINCQYEQGLISTEEFLKFYLDNFPNLTEEAIIEAWNYILKDFPKYRLEFIKQLAKEDTFQLILLSNTNKLHINWIKNTIPFYNAFKNCFVKFYLSHNIGMRKPNTEIFKFVLEENNLNPENCLFIDDTKENTESASRLGIHVWNINETTEDIIDLFTTKHYLF
jgi:putative hydrolase of the HAD superfamily